MCVFTHYESTWPDLDHAPFVLYGVKYIDLVSLAPFQTSQLANKTLFIIFCDSLLFDTFSRCLCLNAACAVNMGHTLNCDGYGRHAVFWAPPLLRLFASAVHSNKAAGSAGKECCKGQRMAGHTTPFRDQLSMHAVGLSGF